MITIVIILLLDYVLENMCRTLKKVFDWNGENHNIEQFTDFLFYSLNIFKTFYRVRRDVIFNVYILYYMYNYRLVTNHLKSR